ncbi:MAG TPA: acyl carrier protein [Solirubrobacteraceae bacterium]
MSVDISVQEITNLLREVIADLLETDVSEVAADADIQDSLCLESLQQLEFMVRIERRLGLTFDIETWIAPRSVQELAGYIATLRAYGSES